MQIKARILTEINVNAIRVMVPVRYGEEDIPRDFPFRTGKTWDVTIDLDTRKIRDWPAGTVARCAMKVCDDGDYYLLDGDRVVKHIQDYVPGCIPGEYGDYINFRIDADGTLLDWTPTADGIIESFFREDD